MIAQWKLVLRSLFLSQRPLCFDICFISLYFYIDLWFMTLNAIISHVEVRISVYLHICILVCMLATVRSCLFLEPLFCVFSVPALTWVKGTFFCFDNYLYIYKKEERLSTLTAGKHVHLLLCQRFSNPGPWTSVGPSTNGFWSVEYWVNTNFPPNY